MISNQWLECSVSQSAYFQIEEVNSCRILSHQSDWLRSRNLTCNRSDHRLSSLSASSSSLRLQNCCSYRQLDGSSRVSIAFCILKIEKRCHFLHARTFLELFTKTTVERLNFECQIHKIVEMIKYISTRGNMFSNNNNNNNDNNNNNNKIVLLMITIINNEAKPKLNVFFNNNKMMMVMMIIIIIITKVIIMIFCVFSSLLDLFLLFVLY